MTEAVPTIPAHVGRVLPALARAAIADEIGAPVPPAVGGVVDARMEELLQAPGAVFVTLHTDGELRGCVGSLEPQRPLGTDVDANARASAVQDRRFRPLSAEDLPRTAIEVSVLSPTRQQHATSEGDAAALLRPGVDGVVLRWRDRRGTFLPSVWEVIPEPREFVERLRLKAGIPEDVWPEVVFETYTVSRFEEES